MRCACDGCARPLYATCVRCLAEACGWCDRCRGCGQVVCERCETEPTPPHAYSGDREPHPHFEE